MHINSHVHYSGLWSFALRELNFIINIKLLLNMKTLEYVPCNTLDLKGKVV